jgi:hypothetical protein
METSCALFPAHLKMITNPNRIKALQPASKFLKPVRWRYRQVLQSRSGVDRLQLSLGSICKSRKRFDDLKQTISPTPR